MKSKLRWRGQALSLLLMMMMAAWPGAVQANGDKAAAPVRLELLTTDSPPFSYLDKDGALTGMSADVVAEMSRRAGVATNFTQRIPWARATRMAQAEANTCAFSMTRNPEREALFHWVGPIALNPWSLYSRPDFGRAAPVTSLADLAPYRIGGLRADAKADYLRAQGFNVELTHEERANPKKLQAGRIDLWVIGRYSARPIAESVGVGPLKLVLVFREVPSYLACSPATSTETLDRLRQALETMRRDGFVERVRERHARHFGWD